MNKSLADIIDDEQKIMAARILILETFGDALIESKSVEEMGEKFRQKVLSL